MADAALEMNLTVQWCYATPTDVLASLEMPAVTNFRVSMDFCYGHSWDVGVSSLIVWAAGSFPSKDTLWTTNNGRFAVPGCNWAPDHETPAAALHVVVALMTTGPVGISDMLNGTNVTLIQRAIRADGTLLKPAKPLTSIDSALAAGHGTYGTGAVTGTSERPWTVSVGAALTAPQGNIYHTYSASNGTSSTGIPASGSVSAYYFVSFKMQSPFPVAAGDFYPPLPPGTALVTRAFGDGVGCSDGASADTCVTFVSADAAAIFTAPTSDHSNVTGGTDYAPVVTTVWPVCASGWVLLGDLSKYVAVSSQRFGAVTCTPQGVTATVTGTSGERIAVSAVRPAAGRSDGGKHEVHIVQVTIPASGQFPLVLSS